MIGDVLVRVNADISGYTKNLDTASKKMETFGRGVQGIGTAMAAGFGSIAAAGVASIGTVVYAASSFESAFASVRKTVDTSEAGFANLRTGILDMSKVLPASANEIAEVAATAGQLGVQEGDILKFTRTMIDLGESTNVSSEQAAKSLAQFANITGMSMDDVDRLGSTIVDLGNNFATQESDIISMAHRLAGAGTQAGMTETDILGFAASLSSLGVHAEAGGSAMSRVFLDMNTAVQDGGEKLEGFAKVAGMSAGDFKKAFEDDAASATVAFISGLGDISDSGGNAAAVLDDLGLGELRVRDALLRASGASELFTDSLNMGRSAWTENTALTEEAAERYKTFASRMDMLKNRVMAVLTVIGEPFIDSLLAIMDAMEPVINYVEQLAEKFANMNEKSQMFVSMSAIILTVVAALGAGLGVLITVAGTVIIALGAISAAIGVSVGALMAIVGVAVAVVAAFTTIIAALVLAYQEFEWFRDIVNSVWESVKEATATTFEFIRDIITTVVSEVAGFVEEVWGMLTQFWMEHGEMILQATQNVWNVIQTVISTVLEAIWEVVKVVWDFIVDATEIAWEAVKGVITGVTDVVLGIVQTFSALFTGNWSAMWDGITRIVTGATNVVRSIIEGAWNLILTTISGIVKAILAVVVSVFSSILTTISSAVNSTKRAISSGFNAALNTVTTIIGNIYTAIANKFTEIKQAVLDKMNEVKTTITDIWDEVMAFFEGIDLFEIGSNIISGLVDGIASMKDAAISKVKEVGEKIKSTLTSFFGIKSPSRVMKNEIGKMLGLGLIEGMGGELSAVTNMAQKVSDAAKPEMPRLEGFNVGDMRGYAGKMSAEMQANVSHSDSRIEEVLSDIHSELGVQSRELGLQSEELRKQKEMIVELDGRTVGKAVEPHVTKEQNFNSFDKRRMPRAGRI